MKEEAWMGLTEVRLQGNYGKFFPILKNISVIPNCPIMPPIPKLTMKLLSFVARAQREFSLNPMRRGKSQASITGPLLISLMSLIVSLARKEEESPWSPKNQEKKSIISKKN